LTGVPGLSSIAVLSSSIAAGFTQTAGDLLGAPSGEQSPPLRDVEVCSEHYSILSGTQLRRPCKMSHGVHFRTTTQCSTG
jgi:hypothetical protein